MPQIGEDPGGYPSQARILYWYHPDYIQNVDLVTDLDGDGQEDLILGNWGLNGWQSLMAGPPRSPAGPVRELHLFHGAWNQDGVTGCLEAYTAPDGRILPMRGLQEIGPLFPGIAERFTTHRAYALATVEAILEGLPSAKVSARWLSSLVLLISKATDAVTSSRPWVSPCWENPAMRWPKIGTETG